MDDTFFRHEVFEVERLEVGDVFYVSLSKFLPGNGEESGGRDTEVGVETGVGVRGKYGTRFFGTVANEHYLSALEPRVIDAWLDDFRLRVTVYT